MPPRAPPLRRLPCLRCPRAASPVSSPSYVVLWYRGARSPAGLAEGRSPGPFAGLPCPQPGWPDRDWGGKPEITCSGRAPCGVLGGFDSHSSRPLLHGVTMAKLIYSAITSLDGYLADEDGNFDWAAPDEEVHTFVNNLERPIGTYLYGRRMYDVMRFWETDDAVEDQSPPMQHYAEIWRAADKVVYSKTMETASSARTRIERNFNPALVRQTNA